MSLAKSDCLSISVPRFLLLSFPFACCASLRLSGGSPSALSLSMSSPVLICKLLRGTSCRLLLVVVEVIH